MIVKDDIWVKIREFEVAVDHSAMVEGFEMGTCNNEVGVGRGVKSMSRALESERVEGVECLSELLLLAERAYEVVGRLLSSER